MTEESRSWYSLAERIAAVHAREPEIKAITVGGSVACGIADANSDVDIFLYCDEYPSEESRRIATEEVKGQGWRCHSNKLSRGILRDCYRAEDARVDMEYVNITAMENVLSEVVDHFSTDHIKQGVIWGMLDSKPLYGMDLINRWQAKAANYPRELTLNMINKYLCTGPLWVPEIYAFKRGDLLFLYEALCQTEKDVLGVLLGLNQIYHPNGFKRVNRLISRMGITPPDLYARLNEIFAAEPQKAVGLLSTIVEEVFDLVEVHAPEVDVESARANFRTDADWD